MSLSVIVSIALLLVVFTLVYGTTFWFVPLILGYIFGLEGMILGIVGNRQTKAGGKKGRGFAIAGMILGIVSFALSLIVRVIYLVINLQTGKDIFNR